MLMEAIAAALEINSTFLISNPLLEVRGGQNSVLSLDPMSDMEKITIHHIFSE
jgi:hypothetical protein